MSDMGMYDYGIDPETLAMLQALLQPNVNKYGEPDTFGLDAQRANINQFQDIYGSLDDPMLALIMGQNSFGSTPTGGGVLGGGGLDPVTTESILETPQTQQMQMLASLAEQGNVTPETYIASMLSRDEQPSTIIADLQAKLADPEGQGLDAATANLFRSWLPRTTDMQGNPTDQVDWNAAAKQINDFASPYLQERATLLGPNITQNDYGQYVSLSQTPSKMQQYLQELGLPDPRAQYGIDFAEKNNPELYALRQEIATKGQEFDAARKTYEQFLKKNPIAKMLDTRSQQADKDWRNRAQNTRLANINSFDTGPSASDVNPVAAAATAASRVSGGGGPFGLPGAIGRISLEGIADQFNLPQLGVLDEAAGSVADSVRGMSVPNMAARALGLGSRPDEGANPPPRSLVRSGRYNIAPMPARNSMMNMLLGRNVRAAPVGTSGKLFLQAERARKNAGNDVSAYVDQFLPTWQGMRGGRTPFQDAVRNRLAGLMAVGGAG